MLRIVLPVTTSVVFETSGRSPRALASNEGKVISQRHPNPWKESSERPGKMTQVES